MRPSRRLKDRLQFIYIYSKGVVYGYQMGLRPQTLYGIADCPVGLAAYFLDHDAWSYALISRVFAGGSAGLTRDDVLDNITITWLTNTALSGARLYWENKFSYFNVKGVSIPVAVSAFPDEIDLCPRSWAERAYPKLIYYNKQPTASTMGSSLTCGTGLRPTCWVGLTSRQSNCGSGERTPHNKTAAPDRLMI
jgi:hypothetical protein